MQVSLTKTIHFSRGYPHLEKPPYGMTWCGFSMIGQKSWASRVFFLWTLEDRNGMVFTGVSQGIYRWCSKRQLGLVGWKMVRFGKAGMIWDDLGWFGALWDDFMMIWRACSPGMFKGLDSDDVGMRRWNLRKKMLWNAMWYPRSITFLVGRASFL